MNCTLCDSLLHRRKDESYFECDTCMGLVKDEAHYLDPATEKGRYLLHNNNVEDPAYQKFTAPIWKYVIQEFKPESKGLDFGSGTGPVISKMLLENNYSIAQYDPYFADSPELLAEKYDYIISCEVIEHFYHPKLEFQRFSEMLKKFGQLICMTLLYKPEIDFKDWNYRKDPTHVFIYQKETIAYITKSFDFHSHEIRNGRMVIWK